MQLFLSDYIRIGAIMETMDVLNANMEGVELIGNLRYCNESIHIKVRVGRCGVARIVSVVGNTKEATFDNLEQLRKIRRDALRLNINGLKKVVAIRTVSTFLWYFCIIAHILMQLIVLQYALVNRAVILPFVLFAIVLCSMKKLISNKWELIPYGANRHGRI